MRKYISTLAALSAALSMAVVVPAAQARPGHHYRGHGGHYGHGGHHYGHYGHRGHGYWHNGRWIALGIGAAIAAGAAGAYYDRDCYYRHGYRYCD